MSDSIFDPTSFLSTEVVGSLSTKTIPVPEGEYLATIEKIDGRALKKRDTGETFYMMDVTWSIDDPDGVVKAHTKRDKNIVVQGIMLDMTEGRNGALVLNMGEGRNVTLGRLREALGQNYSDRGWNPQMLVGNMAKIVVGSRTDSETGDVYATVKKTLKPFSD